MYQRSTGPIYLRLLNPVGFYHNQYIRGNSNPMIVFKFDYPPIQGLNVYTQFGVAKIPLEEPAPSTSGARPTAFAYHLGLQSRAVFKKSIISIALEGVYTDLFFYLREMYNGNSTSYQYGVGYDGIIRVLAGSMASLRYVLAYPLVGMQ